jgi:hypothetical protein
MNKEIKEKWVKALRSGEYKHTYGALRRLVPTENRPVGMCCLGVLCDIVAPNAWEVKVGEAMANHLGMNALPSRIIWEKAGIRVDEFGDPEENATELAPMNDNGASFFAIADWIENNL